MTDDQAHQFSAALAWLTDGQLLRTRVNAPYPLQGEKENCEEYQARLSEWLDLGSEGNKIGLQKRRAALTALENARALYSQLIQDL